MGLGRGVLLVGAHVGSFDALRARAAAPGCHRSGWCSTPSTARPSRQSCRHLNPQIAASIINPRKDGTAVALEIGAALQQGALVTMLADRGRPGNATASVDFLGGDAEFPDGALADRGGAARAHSALRRPVPRRQPVRSAFRDAHRRAARSIASSVSEQLRDVVQDFANRLAALLRVAPYNWFNFYDFWNDPTAGNDRPHAGGHAAATRLILTWMRCSRGWRGRRRTTTSFRRGPLLEPARDAARGRPGGSSIGRTARWCDGSSRRTRR